MADSGPQNHQRLTDHAGCNHSIIRESDSMIMIKGWEVNSLEAKRFSQVGEKMANIRIDHNSTVTSMAVVA